MDEVKVFSINGKLSIHHNFHYAVEISHTGHLFFLGKNLMRHMFLVQADVAPGGHGVDSPFVIYAGLSLLPLMT